MEKLKKVNKEEWVDIAKFQNLYMISNWGRVIGKEREVLTNIGKRRTLKRKFMKLHITSTGYLELKTTINNKLYRRRVHRLVAEAFIPNPNNLPQVNHKDGNKLNNHVDNLEWCNQQHNTKHAYDMGLFTQIGEQNSCAKFSEWQVKVVKRFYRRYPKTNQRIFAKRFGVDQSCISNILRGKNWKHVKI